MGMSVWEAMEVCTKEISLRPGYGGLECWSEASGIRAVEGGFEGSWVRRTHLKGM